MKDQHPVSSSLPLGQGITQLQTEEALRASEERYRAFVEHSSEAIWRTELDAPISTDLAADQQIQLLYERGHVAECNEAMARMHGFANADEAVGSRLGQLLPRLSPANIDLLRAFVRSGYHLVDMRSSEMDRQGGVRHFSNNLIGIVEDGQLTRLWGVKRDVTERRQAEQALRQALGELGALQAIASDVASTLQLEPLLNLIADRLQEIVEYSSMAIFRLEGHVLTVIEYRGPIPRAEALHEYLPVANAPGLEQVVTQAVPVIVPDVLANTPEARDWRQAIHPIQLKLLGEARSWLAVPLVVKNQVIGALRLAHVEPNRFTAHSGELTLAFANQAAVAMENARLYEQARHVAAVEERQRLARDLHDSVSQTLFSASLIADVLPKLYDRDPAQGRELLRDLRDLNRGALAEMRALLLELRPQALHEVPLDVLLRQLASAAIGRSRIPIDIVIDRVCPLSFEVQVALYRIAQEALHNVAKHSSAQRAVTTLHCVPGPDGIAQEVRLSIIDDGMGFDLNQVPADRFGLTIMAERAEGIGATLSIDTTPGHGTRVVVNWQDATSPLL